MRPGRRAAPWSPPDFRRALYAWYRRHFRDLPWRRTRNPYHIWISEVMLQQTRVETARSYYQPFLERFPSVTDLASATQDQVLAAWSGLGYYTRARNLKSAAELLVREHAGAFPRSFEHAVALPGIGRSSAGSILSIAFDDPWPVLDGNVARALQRVHATGRGDRSPAELWRLAEALLPARNGGIHSQAMMELGARVCMPARPACPTCPVSRGCEARARGLQLSVPTPRARPRVQNSQEHAALAWRGVSLVLERRMRKGPLRGMVGLPLAGDAHLLLARFGKVSKVLGELPGLTHAVLDRRIRTRVWEMELPARARLGAGLFAVAPAAVFEQPLDGASRKILKRRL